jgi:hypothetical protein
MFVAGCLACAQLLPVHWSDPGSCQRLGDSCPLGWLTQPPNISDIWWQRMHRVSTTLEVPHLPFAASDCCTCTTYDARPAAQQQPYPSYDKASTALPKVDCSCLSLLPCCV